MAVVLAHHIPLAVMDYLSPVFRGIFPDSKIDKGFAAARTNRGGVGPAGTENAVPLFIAVRRRCTTFRGFGIRFAN